MPIPPRQNSHRDAAFSLIEMMAAAAIMSVLMLLIFGIIQAASNAWKKSSGRIESLQNARVAFESITRRLSQATLNTYYAYFDTTRRPATDPAYTGPAIYGRQSELHFVSGKGLVNGQITHSIFFQAPLGYTDDKAVYGNLEHLLNSGGYYLTYGPDANRPSFLDTLTNAPPSAHRFHLQEFVQPTQELSLYTTDAFSGGSSYKWITEGVTSSTNTRTLAQNVVALLFLPMRSQQDEEDAKTKGLPSLAPDFEYDSHASAVNWVSGAAQPVQMNQLPPLVKVVLVAIDDASAIRLGNTSAAPNLGQLGSSSIFQKEINLEADLKEFEKSLNATPGNIAGNSMKLNYRVFQTEVAIRGAKWSE